MYGIVIDKGSKLPIIRQIHQQIRKRILEGHLQAGDKLPSTRDLSKDLRVSRNVVLEAYDLLLAEGYVKTKQGNGTFVAEEALLDIAQHITEKSSKNKDFSFDIANPNIIDFKPGIPDLSIFPRSKWLKCYNDIVKHCPNKCFGYQKPEGVLQLRSALVDFLYKTRGIECEDEQIIITTGAAQGLSIISKLINSTNETMCIEDPSSKDIYEIFSSNGYEVKSVEVDEFGIDTKQLLKYNKTKLIYVTPSHQYPIGGLLPIQRRIELIKYAREHNSYIIEDDYDSEFRYTTSPVCSLFELDPNHVIYLGTFSKNLSPAFRMGYMILPKPLIEKCKELKWYTDLHSPSLVQMALAKFIEQGELEGHIRKGCKLYKKKHQTLIDQLYKMFPNVKLFGVSTGLHLTVEFPSVQYKAYLIEQLKREKVMIYPVQNYIKVTKKHQNKWILGFGHLSVEDIKIGIERLSKVFNT